MHRIYDEKQTVLVISIDVPWSKNIWKNVFKWIGMPHVKHTLAKIPHTRMHGMKMLVRFTWQIPSLLAPNKSNKIGIHHLMCPKLKPRPFRNISRISMKRFLFFFLRFNYKMHSLRWFAFSVFEQNLNLAHAFDAQYKRRRHVRQKNM